MVIVTKSDLKVSVLQASVVEVAQQVAVTRKKFNNLLEANSMIKFTLVF